MRMGSFDGEEMKELLVSALVITAIFTYGALTGDAPLAGKLAIFTLYFIFVGLGFTLHEMAHKLMAINRGAWSRFVMWKEGLLFAILMKVTVGATFIAPGATYWAKPFASREDYGRVSAAGPITNLVLAAAFWMASFPVPLFRIGTIINVQLALFNLLPVPPLDGSKIISWKPEAWAGLFALSIAMLIAAG